MHLSPGVASLKQVRQEIERFVLQTGTAPTEMSIRRKDLQNLAREITHDRYVGLRVSNRFVYYHGWGATEFYIRDVDVVSYDPALVEAVHV